MLTGAPKPHVLFFLESCDTLKFSSHDIYSMLDNNIKKQIKSQGYLTSQTWQDLANIMKNQSRDTLVSQNLSSVDDKTISGILDIWVVRELLLKGQAIVALKGETNIPKRLKYVFLRDNLGGQQGNFYTDDNKLIYSTVIAFGE
ncbi:MAG: hypothetical protein LCH58_06755 [Bacteroidetes bacterium]|jgi:hypothetical protein|uniref:hypothetical protein n=1 Tax=Phnomibacter sp. TaxID=2836217 RepID=UPI002FDD790D|nr:hypothetical protein [Bacteroidota bacterium]